MIYLNKRNSIPRHSAHNSPSDNPFLEAPITPLPPHCHTYNNSPPSHNSIHFCNLTSPPPSPTILV
ncbi:hypothetical protein Sjap_007654 [Stephania japonica]|uniref:Uncharacterized protein n=1 Tax=Stephania japonica TaxID=461633 RepID=A0AAP0JNW7_9MAGN